MSSLCPASCEKYKRFAIDNSQNAQQKTNPGDTPETQDETTDTGFNETLAHNAHFTDHPENTALATPKNGETSETRSRTMTEKGFRFCCELKEKSAKAAHKSFHANVTAFHAFLAGTKDRNQIDRKLKDIIALAEKTEIELNIWLDLVKHTPRSELIVELLSSIKDSIQAVQTAAFNRVLALDKDETLSVSASMRSKSSRTSRHSINSSYSGSSRSSRESFLTVKAKRAGLEEKMKFSDKIEEQQRILNKLKMQQELNEFLAAEAVYEEALKEEKPPGNEEMDLELPKETENMIDRFLNHASHPTLSTTATESLLPPSMNENNAQQFVTSGDNTGNPHHVGLSDNITLPDGGLMTNFHLDTGHKVVSHPSNVSEHEPLYHVEIAEQLKSDPTTNSPPETHQGTGMPTPQIPAFATNISYPCTSHYTSPAETSTPIVLLPQGPTNRSTGPLTSHSHAGPVSKSKPIPSSTYKLRGDADAFPPNCSPTTLYREIRIPPPESQNRAPPSSNCRRLSKSHATATAPTSQARHIYWRRNRHQILHLGNSVRRAYRLRADQRSAETVSFVPTLRRKREKSR